MGEQRQKNQYALAFDGEDKGEAPKNPGEGTEASTADDTSERPADDEHLM